MGGCCDDLKKPIVILNIQTMKGFSCGMICPDNIYINAVDRTWTMVTEGILLCPINKHFISLFPGSVLFQVIGNFQVPPKMVPLSHKAPIGFP